jgi:predicted HAD superfamily Cof-like phosphohydrolase
LKEEMREVEVELEAISKARTAREQFDSLRRLLKELADLRYVTEGAAVAFGLDIDGAYAEVHRSNMTKLGPDGRPIYNNGKVMKGPNYEPADMAKFVQILEGEAV